MATRRTPFESPSDPPPADPPPATSAAAAAPADPQPGQMPVLDTPEKVLAYLKDNPSVLQMMSKQEIIAMFTGGVQAEEQAKAKADAAAQEQAANAPADPTTGTSGAK